LHRQVVGKVAVDPEEPRTQGALGGGVEVHDLPAGMDASVGASRRDRGDRVIRNPGDGGGQFGLDAAGMALMLPTEKRGAVVLQPRSEARKRRRDARGLSQPGRPAACGLPGVARCRPPPAPR
jgi:hypothetical protein